MVSYIKEFENYLLSDFSEESLSAFIPGSEQQLYLSILNQIKSISKSKKLPENVNFPLNL